MMAPRRGVCARAAALVVAVGFFGAAPALPARARGYSPDVPTERAAGLYAKHEAVCLSRGWQRLTVRVGARTRQLLWRAPAGAWTQGAIVAFHGGGGMDSNFCSPAVLGQPMVDFADLALSRGFAVFSPDAARGVLTDAEGNSCGKRWHCLRQAHERAPNEDIAFVRTLLTDIIPGLRPAGSATAVFATGVSNGGFMSALVATQLPHLVAAFAPVSAGDPYGTHMDCGLGLVTLRKSAPGEFLDNGSGRSVAKREACAAPYLREQPWPDHPGPRPPFKLFYHEGDAGVDVTCKHRLRHFLAQRGYPDDGAFVIEHRGRRTIARHFWLAEYNEPILAFFERAREARR